MRLQKGEGREIGVEVLLVSKNFSIDNEITLLYNGTKAYFRKFLRKVRVIEQ